MATRFELVLHGADERRLRAAGEEALAEIRAAERRLSRFLPGSDIGRINASPDGVPVRVDGRTADLLATCVDWSHATRGAFDVTVGPLVEIWREALAAKRLPNDAILAQALSRVGWRGIAVRADRGLVEVKGGRRLDLGGVGKGEAIDQAITVLKGLDVESALLHGGTSSVRVLGYGPKGAPWRVVCGAPSEIASEDGAEIELRPGDALAVSSQLSQSVELNGHVYGHVVDPRTGYPAKFRGRTAVVGPSAAQCDALATALLVMSDREVTTTQPLFPDCRFHRWPGVS